MFRQQLPEPGLARTKPLRGAPTQQLEQFQAGSPRHLPKSAVDRPEAKGSQRGKRLLRRGLRGSRLGRRPHHPVSRWRSSLRPAQPQRNLRLPSRSAQLSARGGGSEPEAEEAAPAVIDSTLSAALLFVAADLEHRGYPFAGPVRRAAQAVKELEGRERAASNCPQCGRPVIRGERGRPKTFCSGRCRTRAWRNRDEMVR